MTDPESVLHHYLRLIALRKQLPVMVHGRYELLLRDHTQIYAYIRTLEQQRLLVVCNFSGDMPDFELPASVPARDAQLLVGNWPVDLTLPFNAFQMRPYEARLYLLD